MSTLYDPICNRMIEDLRLRNYSERTVEAYVFHVKQFAEHCGRSPAEVGLEEIRAFQLHVVERKVSWSYFNQAVCALRFLYRHTLHRTETIQYVAYAKMPAKLPVVLSPEEVRRLLDAVVHPVYRLVLLTLYAGGFRLEEVLVLRPRHIDSERMVIHIEHGKGKKDRDVPLSRVLLDDLRTYWKTQRPGCQGDWLFPSPGGNYPVHSTTVQDACREASRAAGLTKHVTPHTLRHCYATHMLEAGTDLRTLQALLGHADLRTTAIYTHVARKLVPESVSPLDRLPGSTRNVPR